MSLARIFLKITRHNHFHIFYKLVAAVISAILIFSIKFDLLDIYLFDLQLRTGNSLGLIEKKDSNIVLIEITPETVKQFGGYPKIDEHIKLLNKLKNCNGCTLIYNLRRVGSQLLNFDGTYDMKFDFTKTANSFSNFYLIQDDMDLKGNGAILSAKLAVPMENLNLHSAPKTLDSKLNPKSPVTRRIILDYNGQKLTHWEIANKYNSTITHLKSINGVFEKSGTNQLYINFRPKNSFEKFDFKDVISNSFDSVIFDNKIVILGENTFNSIDDYADSPFVVEGKDLITTSELHANMLQTLISNNAPEKTNREFNFTLTLLIAILTVFVALSAKPSRGIVILLVTFVSVFVISMMFLLKANVWINLAHPLLTIFLCYYFFIPYRLIIENRRSWEYLQKNKLLQQVEELKTNFISMMSHDLKTPIARIQGMTEVILKDEVTLSPQQREAVDTIKGSSDDLLKFINSILQYGRIESQGVELHRQSKDINQVLQDVIKKHEFLAKVKKIKVQTELEPLFPIHLDVDLMKQVLSNLVENAIKYSHEDSTVTIRSREEGTNIVVEVQDNGVGIPAEDLPNIFMKFYRSQNVKTSTIKGTGLGLYLAKYFAELHKGTITVTSDVGQGSTFRLELPS